MLSAYASRKYRKDGSEERVVLTELGSHIEGRHRLVKRADDLAPLVHDGEGLGQRLLVATIAVLSTAFGLLGTLLAVPATVAAGVLVEELWFRRLEARDS